MTPKEKQAMELADWLIWNTDDLLTVPKVNEWMEKRQDYTRLRAELEKEEVGSAEEMLNTVMGSFPCGPDRFVVFNAEVGTVRYIRENIVIEAMHQFASQSPAPKMPTEEQVTAATSALQKEVDELRREMEWISVKDRLPENDDLVCEFIFISRGGFVKTFIGDWKSIQYFREYELKHEYTHWRLFVGPTPSPTEVKKEV